MIGKLFGLILACVFVGALAPTAIGAIVNTTTTGWGVGAIALWGVLSVVIVGAFVMMILKEAGIEF